MPLWLRHVREAVEPFGRPLIDYVGPRTIARDVEHVSGEHRPVGPGEREVGRTQDVIGAAGRAIGDLQDEVGSHDALGGELRSR